jgi:hypothetical protein
MTGSSVPRILSVSAATKQDAMHFENCIQNLPAGFIEAKRRSVKLDTVTTARQKHYISDQFSHDILRVLRLSLDWVGANQSINLQFFILISYFIYKQ